MSKENLGLEFFFSSPSEKAACWQYSILGSKSYFNIKIFLYSVHLKHKWIFFRWINMFRCPTCPQQCIALLPRWFSSLFQLTVSNTLTDYESVPRRIPFQNTRKIPFKHRVLFSGSCRKLVIWTFYNETIRTYLYCTMGQHTYAISGL